MWKKIISALMTIALVFSLINYMPSVTKADQSGAANYDWSSVPYLGNSVAGDYTNKYKMVVAEGTANIVNIQLPGFATAPGVYVTFADANFGEVTVNGTVTNDYDQQGAGFILHMTMFPSGTSSVVVKDGSGAVKAELYVKNESGSTEETTTATTEETTTTPGEELSQLAAPTKVAVYNFYAQQKGYRVDFTPVEGAVSYNVFLDGTNIGNVTKSGQYFSADLFTSKADGNLHKVTIRTVDSEGKMSAYSETASVRVLTETNSTSDPSDIARIYVVTNKGEKGGASLTKPDKTSASLTIIGADGKINTASDGGTIKKRGNSTSLADKPAYNISFNSKKEIIPGKAKGKKWCLLANAYEKTLIRNKLAMDFGQIVGGIATPKEEYADLYIDGVYKGNFVISEPAENGRSGCSYDDGNTSNEILFELESERTEDGCLYYTTSKTGSRFVTEDTTDTASSRYTNWVSTLEKFDGAVVKPHSDEVFNYMDVDSFVSMYIINELFQTVDFGYSSVKFYITYDETGAPTIHAGPLWDFDLSSGNSSFAENRTYDTMRGQNVNYWFKYLMQNSTFKNKVLTKYEQLQPRIQNLYKDNKYGFSKITQLTNYIEKSRIRNYTPTANGGAGWSESTADGAEYSVYPYSYSTVAPYSTYTYAQHIEYLTNWLKNRNQWLCSQWGVNYSAYDSEYTGTLTSSDLGITGYQISTSFNGVKDAVGFRAIYQAEPKVEGQSTDEVGIIYGLVHGNNAITKDDMVYGSDNSYVASYAATDAGKFDTVMGDSKTATYYARTMEYGDNLSSDAFNSKYYVRVYAKLSDGTIAYSDIKTYTVFDVAKKVYTSNLCNTKSGYDCIYNKILKKVDSSFAEGDFNWNNTIAKPTK